MLTIYTILVFIAILLQAFFTASEMAFTSTDRIKLKSIMDSGDPRAVKLHSFLEKEGLYLGTTLFGTNIAVVVSSVLVTRILMEYFEPSLSPLLTTCIMVPVTLIFAEIVPKMIARQFSTIFALRAVVPLSSFYGLFHPMIVAVNSVARFLLTPFSKKRTSWEETFTKRDLKRILLMGQETGEVEADEVELIHKILDFGAKKVEEIMVPLYRLSSISADDSIDDLKRLVSLTGFSRIPVYRKTKNNIIGIINIYDILFKEEDAEKKASLEDFVRAPVYVNKSDPLDMALTRLRNQKQPMGIAVDSNNNVGGIITIEDILEEIVGEIEDVE